MLSYVLSSATSYFHLPIDEDPDEGVYPKQLSWTAEPETPLRSSPRSRSSPTFGSSSGINPHDPPKPGSSRLAATMNEVLGNNDLYEILGLKKSSNLDKVALRRAYLSRSRACHPDKFPDNPEATHAFQKVSVAYDVLSKPSTKRMYDARTPSSPFDFFAAQHAGQAEETFRGVIINVFNDFLDGDLEMIKTLLRAMNDINPTLKLGDESVDSVLVSLQSIRDRALTCRAVAFAMHVEVSRILDLQHSFRQLRYFDLMGRMRLTIELTRVTISLPIALDRAIQQQAYNAEDPKSSIPRHVNVMIRGIDVVLERMERMLK